MKRYLFLIFISATALAAPQYSVSLYKSTSKVKDITALTQADAWDKCYAEVKDSSYSCKTLTLKSVSVPTIPIIPPVVPPSQPSVLPVNSLIITNGNGLAAGMADMSYGAICNWNDLAGASCVGYGVQPGFIPNKSIAGFRKVQHIAIKPVSPITALYTGARTAGDVETGRQPQDFNFVDAKHCSPYPLSVGQWSRCTIQLSEYWPPGKPVPDVWYKSWVVCDLPDCKYYINEWWIE